MSLLCSDYTHKWQPLVRWAQCLSWAPSPLPPHACHARHPGEEVTGKCYHSRGLGLSWASHMAWPLLQFEDLFFVAGTACHCQSQAILHLTEQ